MGTKRGRVPDDKELTSLLDELSQRLYKSEWTIGIATYDSYRPKGLALGNRILRARGLAANSEGWAILAQRLTKRPVMSIEEVRRRNAKKCVEARWGLGGNNFPAWANEPGERLGESEWRQARMVSDRMVLWEADHWLTERALTFVSGHGMNYIGRWIEIRKWDVKRKRYVVVGKQAVLEVR